MPASIHYDSPLKIYLAGKMVVRALNQADGVVRMDHVPLPVHYV